MVKKISVKEHSRVGTDGVRAHNRTLADVSMGKQKGNFGSKQLKWVNESDQKVMIVHKIGNWDIGLIKFDGNDRIFLFVRGLEYGENPIIYSHNMTVAYDRPEQIPTSVKNYVSYKARELYELKQREQRKL